MAKKDFRKERKQRRLEENRLFILKAAERVFAQKGYNLTSMDAIAAESQFSKATLYSCFKSKSEIFFEIVFNSFEEAHQKMTKILKKKMRAEEKLRELIYYTTSSYNKKRNITRILFIERSVMKKIFKINPEEHVSYLNQHPQIPYEFKVKMEEIYKIICEVIEEGIESGEFRNVNVKDAASVFGAMIRGFHFRGPLRDKKYSIEESTELLHSFFLCGIRKER